MPLNYFYILELLTFKIYSSFYKEISYKPLNYIPVNRVKLEVFLKLTPVS